MYTPIEQPTSPEDVMVCTCEWCGCDVEEDEGICYNCKADAACEHDDHG